MPIGPKRVAPISKKVAKKAVVKPMSQLASGTGIVGDKRPKVSTGNFQRMKWGMTNRQTAGDWTW